MPGTGKSRSDGTKAAIFGATGPIGRRVAAALLEREVEVRVVSRSLESLMSHFEGWPVEHHPADLEDPDAAIEAARGCDLVVHAVGLPADRFERHVPVARNAVAAASEAGARAFLVTSYWSYGPGDRDPMPESRPTAPGSEKAAIRAEQERVFLGAGGAVARLPDFYGPDEGLSLLNDALDAVRLGKTATWPGDPDAPREFLYYPDAGRIVADLALRDEAYGEPWNVPGSGPETPRRILAMAAAAAGTTPKVRRVRPWMARLVGIFRSDVRAAVDVMPLYDAPAVLDTSKIEGLLGTIETTPYEAAVGATLAWLEGRREPAAG